MVTRMANTYETEKIDGTYHCIDDAESIDQAAYRSRERGFLRHCQARAYAGLVGSSYYGGLGQQGSGLNNFLGGWPY